MMFPRDAKLAAHKNPGLHEERSRQAVDHIESKSARFGVFAGTHLRGRGIKGPLPRTLGYDPDCPHPKGARLPALVAWVEGGASPALHRTYLGARKNPGLHQERSRQAVDHIESKSARSGVFAGTHLRPDGTGKADIEPQRAMLGAVRGGAVRLTASGPTLAVSEGIETGLSLASGMLERPATIWAALSSTGLRSLRLPSAPGDLIVAEDGDAAGRSAGFALAERAHALGWVVWRHAAPDGQDWNDVLRRGGRP